MPDFDSCDFIAVAEDLFTCPNSGQQAYLRTVAGRAYYAAYGIVRRELINQCGYVFPNKTGKHGPIQDACAAAPNVSLNNLGTWLNQAYTFRVRADYSHKERENLTEVDAEGSIDSAKEAIKIVKALTRAELQILRSNIRN